MSHITPSQLPSDRNLTFYDSGFFRKPGNPRTLPTPQKIRDIANVSANPNARQRSRPPPVVLEDLGLLVKYGTEITIAEGQCLRILHKLLPGIVPVPEVYGWCEDDGQVFIYMELMSGITLERSWGTMSREDRVGICQQLRRMIEAWRTLKQDPRNPFIGSEAMGLEVVANLLGHIGGQPLSDIIFAYNNGRATGPFQSVPKFHDYFTTAYGPNRDGHDETPHEFRHHFPDQDPIVFTHADLHPSNILVSAGPNPRVLAIVDWHQSGWYPAYWEYCKARWTSRIGGEWETEYLPLFLKPHDCYDYFDYFCLCRGV